MKKGFTLIELVVAVALLVIVMTFAGLIFKVGIGSYRLANANAEIMRNLRAMTDQLNSDFAGFQKDGYLIIKYHVVPPDNIVRSDRIYFFTTGDFQSWFPDSSGDYPQSNIARICWGHDLTNVAANQWPLARNMTLVIFGTPPADCSNISFSQWKIPGSIPENPDTVLDNPAIINMTTNPNSISQLFCQNVGGLKIQWTDGTIYPVDPSPPSDLAVGQLVWFDLDRLRQTTIGLVTGDTDYSPIENAQRIVWTPETAKKLLPRAIKFTFTLYDSKGVIKSGRTLAISFI